MLTAVYYRIFLIFSNHKQLHKEAPLCLLSLSVSPRPTVSVSAVPSVSRFCCPQCLSFLLSPVSPPTMSAVPGVSPCLLSQSPLCPLSPVCIASCIPNITMKSHTQVNFLLSGEWARFGTYWVEESQLTTIIQWYMGHKWSLLGIDLLHSSY